MKRCKSTKTNKHIRTTKPKVCWKGSFQSSVQGFSHCTVMSAASWLQVNSCWLLNFCLPREPEFRAHHSHITKCRQPLENCSSAKQDGKTQLPRIQTQDPFRPAEDVGAPSAAGGARWVPTRHHQPPKLCLPSAMLPSPESAAYRCHTPTASTPAPTKPTLASSYLYCII